LRAIACRDYVGRLTAADARISMAAKGSPRENAQAESFFRTLKHEEVYLTEYDNYPQAKQALDRFIERVYNEKRLHSSLGYRPPNEFEELVAAGSFS
jgi:transposase InsO family protein